MHLMLVVTREYEMTNHNRKHSIDAVATPEFSAFGSLETISINFLKQCKLSVGYYILTQTYVSYKHIIIGQEELIVFLLS